MKTSKNNYSAPQEILYSVCNAAWYLCSQYLTRFTALNAFYTEAFVANALQAVQDAKALPDSRQTLAARKEARINLSNATRQVQANWQLLKVYITKAFAADMVATKLEAAGGSLYAKASVDNWSAVRSLIDTANGFIANNLADLAANENMPATFPALFKTDGDNCIELSVIYAQANMEKEAATRARIDANNAIYAGVMEMLKDGQQIFKDDLATKKQFTFSYLVLMYQAGGSASLKGYIINSDNLPIEGVTIASQDGKYFATTDAKGYYRITRIAEGTYQFSITCPGYNPLVQTISFAAGTASKGDFEMTNEMTKAA
ncbi:carboxypeptidase regulatory-like domain-containing protein [Ginsengibacter hankyongi]|uniref:Carboxypeptidase regulatory-like domain-containing protein n=1 Tax=Ginsengibacter hankyongi TaxID=2607284 RepID=A0A5J5IBT8_9BACT|nr:carboxypeptidase-like regulatory domain-containing protein [Ginsengibacter hankyongi]KAA9036504.1 carboxypeptidase regulatory-like domain-containing protein [Ginsengibacter hankyongi]